MRKTYTYMINYNKVSYVTVPGHLKCSFCGYSWQMREVEERNVSPFRYHKCSVKTQVTISLYGAYVLVEKGRQ